MFRRDSSGHGALGALFCTYRCIWARIKELWRTQGVFLTNQREQPRGKATAHELREQLNTACEALSKSRAYRACRAPIFLPSHHMHVILSMLTFQPQQFHQNHPTPSYVKSSARCKSLYLAHQHELRTRCRNALTYAITDAIAKHGSPNKPDF